VIPSPYKLLAAFRGFSLLRTAAGTLGLKIGAAGMGFFNSILLARLLGPAEFGVYSIVLSVVNFATTLAVLGLPTLATREAAANAEQNQWNQLKGLLRASHRWTLLAALSILGIFVILFGSGVVKPHISWAEIVIAMALIPLSAFNQLRAAILRGLHWVILADIPELLLRPTVMLLLLAGIYLSATHITAAHALGIQLATAGFALTFGTWWLTSKQPTTLKKASPDKVRCEWLLHALPFLGTTIISVLQGQISLYLLGYLSGVEHAGLFQAANQLVSLIVIGLMAINMPLQPKLAAAWARDDKQQAQRLVTETARMGFSIALAGGLVMLVYAESVLRLYSAHYVEAADSLRILAIGQMINAAAGSCGILLQMTGHQRVVMQGTAIALLLNMAIAIYTIPLLGVEGGALATTVGMIFWNIYFGVYARYRLGINTTILFIGWR
jgi:O-antigen/teichoic acid export membrane protein